MNLKRALIICCVLSVIGIILGLSLAYAQKPALPHHDRDRQVLSVKGPQNSRAT
jgi:hypothetical protein